MAIQTVGLDDTFDQWRQKNNITASDLGDKSLLNTVDKSSVVAAVNEVASKSNEFSVAMAIALG